MIEMRIFGGSSPPTKTALRTIGSKSKTKSTFIAISNNMTSATTITKSALITTLILIMFSSYSSETIIVAAFTNSPIYPSLFHLTPSTGTIRPLATTSTANTYPIRLFDTAQYMSSTIDTSFSSPSSSSLAKTTRKQKKRPMPVVGYNADTICEFYDRSPLVVGWRLNSLSFPLLGWYIGLLCDQTFSKQDSPNVQRKRGEQLRHHLANSGSVTLIKSGQALSLRPDVLKNKIWAQELGKLVDEVGSFSDMDAMNIMSDELSDLKSRIVQAKVDDGRRRKRIGIGGSGNSGNTAKNMDNNDDIKTQQRKQMRKNRRSNRRLSRLELQVEQDPILSLFEFSNSNLAVASASIGQVYKARIRRGPALEAAIGKVAASQWGGKTVAIKIQRPDASAAASLDMYLLRRTAMWASKFRGGDLTGIVDTFGEQLFGELDYVREADNCERFRELYGDWNNVIVPRACMPLTRKKVLVMDWVEGEKGPWQGQEGIDMVSLGLKCSVDQLLNTGLFHADPHRGNLLRSPKGKLAFIDFGMMADVSEEERYGLVGLAIGLQNKDLPLVTENLLKLGFLEDTTQLDVLVPRLRQAFINATGGTGKGSDVNFSKLQAELDAISRENVLKFKTPGFFTVIIRSLTILEGFALSVDPNFRLVRGAYPYVLAQLVAPENNAETPKALRMLLVRLLTKNGEEKEIEWERLRDFLFLAQKAQKSYNPTESEDDSKGTISRKTIDLLFKFMTSQTGLFLKKPLVYELAETIDGIASLGEANLLRITNGLIRPLPGGNGPVNRKRMDELGQFLNIIQDALVMEGDMNMAEEGRARMEALMAILREMISIVSDDRRREEFRPLLQEVISVFQMVAVQVLEIRGSRAMRNILQLSPAT